MRIFCTAILAAVLAQDDDLDFFARGKKNKNKSKGKPQQIPTTTEEPTTTTTTTTTTTSTTTTTAPQTTTNKQIKNYADPILNEIFNKKEREEYQATTVQSPNGDIYNPPQQVNYNGELSLNEIEIKMMLQPDFKKFCWNCNVGGNNSPEELKEKCLNGGKYEACSSGNSDCYVTMRKSDGAINMLQSGCKQLAACSAESRQTLQGQNASCKPAAVKGPSHCNYCCDYENCNLEFLESNNYDPALSAFQSSA